MLQKFIVCTLKYPQGTPWAGQTYEGSPITEQVYNDINFQKNFQLLIKKARVVSYDSDEYLRITGLTREQVDALKPKPVAPVKVKEPEKPFVFPKLEELENTSKVEKPVATKRNYTKRTGKNASKV